MLGLKSLNAWLGRKARRAIRQELLREAQASLMTHNAARQALDLYEMKLETLDTRVAKRILALEDRIATLEAQHEVAAPGTHRAQPRKAV